MEPRNRYQGIDSASLCSLAGKYDNPIPTQFLATIDCLKIPAQSKLLGTSTFHSQGVWDGFRFFFKFIQSFAISARTDRFLPG
jgi:hypothetical protein